MHGNAKISIEYAFKHHAALSEVMTHDQCFGTLWRAQLWSVDCNLQANHDIGSYLLCVGQVESIDQE